MFDKVHVSLNVGLCSEPRNGKMADTSLVSRVRTAGTRWNNG